MRFPKTPRSIAGALTFWFLVIALVPCGVILVGTSLTAMRRAHHDVEERLGAVLRARATALEVAARSRVREANALSHAPALSAAVADLTKARAEKAPDLVAREESRRAPIARLLKGSGPAEALILDPEGNTLLRLGTKLDPSTPLGDGPLGKALARAKAEKAAVRSEPRIDPGRGVGIAVAAPILDPEGAVAGLFACTIPDEELQSVLDDRAGLGETGRVYAGVLDAERDRALTLNASGSSGAADGPGGPLREAVRGQTGAGPARDARGHDVVAAWTYVPAVGLGLVLEQQASEAFGPLRAEWFASLGLLAAMALLVLVGAWLAARSLSRPISRVIAASRRVAEGDLTAHDDDLGEPGSGESGDLVRSIREMTARLRTLIGHVQESIVMLLSTATEIAATSRQQERTVHEYGDSINQVAAAVNQITATSQELSRTMNDVNGLASTAGAKVKDGQDLLGGLLSTMHQLGDSTASISSRLTVISERASNINLVVTTITKVADQTNLLSINAAIEAEKAGEFGRGFSVVAREIRRLADQTASATLDIERIVKEMQHSVATGVMEMDKYHVQVRQGVRDAEVIGDRLGQIISAVERLTPRFDQVAEGMSAQSQGAQQIREAMGQLAEGAGQTIQSLREFNKATDQLRDAVTNLKDDVARFQT